MNTGNMIEHIEDNINCVDTIDSNLQHIHTHTNCFHYCRHPVLGMRAWQCRPIVYSSKSLTISLSLSLLLAELDGASRNTSVTNEVVAKVTGELPQVSNKGWEVL